MNQNLTQYYNYFQQNQNSSLPFAIEFDSHIPGPTVMYVGSTHGSEPAGTVACVEIHQKLISGEIILKQGKIVFVLGNPEAFLHSKRFMETNLNRVFSAEIASGLEGERALEFRQYFQDQRVDYLVDLHSVSMGNFQFVIYFHNHETLKTAINISPIDTHFLADKDMIPGTLIEEVRRYGGEGFVIECGNHNHPHTQKVAKNHILSSMNYFGLAQISEGFTDQKTDSEVCVYEVVDLIKPQIGFKFISPEITTGSFIKSGDVFVTFDTGEYKAKQDLFIVMPDHHPNINDHDAGFLCTKKMISR